MKKSLKSLAWISIFCLSFGLSGVCSFLFFLGPIISGIVLTKISTNFLPITKKVIIMKSVYFVSGLLALLIVQLIFLKFSLLIVFLNVICFLAAFTIGGLDIFKKEQQPSVIK